MVCRQRILFGDLFYFVEYVVVWLIAMENKLLFHAVEHILSLYVYGLSQYPFLYVRSVRTYALSSFWIPSP